MAPPNNIRPNPICFRTRKALRVMGKLIEDWSIKPETRPKNSKIEANGRIIVIPVADFRQLLENQPGEDALRNHNDFHIRDDITEVELILRQTGRAPIMLPEPEAVEYQIQMAQAGQQMMLDYSRLYLDMDPDEVSKGFPVSTAIEDENTPATYHLRIVDQNPLDTFLRPYMASYCCSQCT